MVECALVPGSLVELVESFEKRTHKVNWFFQKEGPHRFRDHLTEIRKKRRKYTALLPKQIQSERIKPGRAGA
jgi:hypothetical protein